MVRSLLSRGGPEPAFALAPPGSGSATWSAIRASFDARAEGVRAVRQAALCAEPRRRPARGQDLTVEADRAPGRRQPDRVASGLARRPLDLLGHRDRLEG